MCTADYCPEILCGMPLHMVLVIRQCVLAFVVRTLGTQIIMSYQKILIVNVGIIDTIAVLWGGTQGLISFFVHLILVYCSFIRATFFSLSYLFSHGM